MQNAVINVYDSTTIGAANVDYENEHVICSGTTLTVDGTHAFASLTLQNTCTLTQTATTSGTVNRTILTMAGAVSVDSTSTINMDGRGFPIGYTSNGAGGATTTNASTSNKGSHGGFGGLGAAGNNGLTYDSVQEPVDPGGGSGANAGGGYVKIVANSLALSGTIRANGASAGCCSGGAGGGIWISVTGAVTGSGSVLANGGNGTDINNGSGGGGRVAFYYNTSVSGNGSLGLAFQVYGGTNAGAVANNVGGAGTLYTERTNIDVATRGTVSVNNNSVLTGRTSTIPDSTYGAINVSNRALAENVTGTVIVTDAVTINNTATFSASTLTVTNAVTLTNTATLNHTTSTSSTVYRLNLTAGSLSVDATSSVNLDELVFRPAIPQMVRVALRQQIPRR